jgi:hypothetical protein
MRRIDYTGRRYGRLVVIGDAQPTLAGKRACFVRCDCGNELSVTTSGLATGKTRSCGCLSKEMTLQRSLKHGHAHRGKHHSAYGIWAAMRSRCELTTHHKYPIYGGRGIKVCDRWQAFENFLADMGERPHGTSIDRINNDGNYEPTNCRWATNRQQSRNQRVNVMVEMDGQVLCLIEWTEKLGIPYDRTLARIEKGWDPVLALTTPRYARRESGRRGEKIMEQAE